MHILSKPPFFPDGELDLWPAYKDVLPNRAAINSPAKKEAEERCHELVNGLGKYAIGGETSFFVTHPNNVRIVNGSLHDIWAFTLGDDDSTAIQIPRHVVSTRPETGEAVQFRPEVPAFLILGSMAHELAHRDRALRDPERHRIIFNGFHADNRHELDLSGVRHEEMATDVEAYGILQAMGSSLTPHDYIATVPQPRDYHQELASLLTPKIC
jgi:hypothetical protein